MKSKILLHSCCAPCSSTALERLRENFDVTVFYYNLNIYPETEFDKRFSEQERLLAVICSEPIPLIKGKYDYGEFLSAVKGFENEPEGGTRCEACIKLRLRETAKLAENGHYDFFGTTLTVSPHKNAATVNGVLGGLPVMCAKPYFADFKKKDGYKRSVELSNIYGIYRQNYCGCEFSLRY